MEAFRSQPFTYMGVARMLEPGVLTEGEVIEILQLSWSNLSLVEPHGSCRQEESIKALSHVLSRQEYLLHKNEEINSLVAVCMSEAFRCCNHFYVFDRCVLRDIYRLFTMVFGRLNNKSLASLLHPKRLLDNLSKFKMCEFMVFLRFDDLIEDMLELFFSLSRTDIDMAAFSAIVTILTSIIQAGDVPFFLLEIILKNLTSLDTHSKICLKILAGLILGLCHTHLQFPLIECIEMRLSIATLPKDFHQMISSILWASPKSLDIFISNLKIDLLSDKVILRSRAITRLTRILILPGRLPGRECSNLWSD